MTSIANPNLSSIFNTEDPNQLKSNIKHEYLRTKEMTRLVKKVPSKNAQVKYRVPIDEWTINSAPFASSEKLSCLWECKPAAPCRRAAHNVALRNKKYKARFEGKVDCIVNAYVAAIQYEMRKKKFDEMQSDLRQLKQNLPNAEAAVREAFKPKPIAGLEALEKKLQENKENTDQILETIEGLNNYNKSFDKVSSKNVIQKCYSKVVKTKKNERKQLVNKLEEQKANGQSIGFFDLKTREEVENSLILAEARLAHFREEKGGLEREIEVLKEKHTAAVNAEKVRVYEYHMQLVKKIEDLEREIKIFKIDNN